MEKLSYAWHYLALHKAIAIACFLAVSQYLTTVQAHVPESERPQWLTFLCKWLGYLAPDGTRGLFGSRLSVPLIHYPTQIAPKIPPAVVGLLLCVGLFAGCAYCANGANKNTLECKAYSVFTTCGPGVAEIVLSEVTAIEVDPVTGLLELAGKLTSAEYTCVTNILKQNATAKYGAGSPQVTALTAAISRTATAPHPVKR